MGTQVMGPPCSRQRVRWMVQELRFVLALAMLPVVLALVGCTSVPQPVDDPRQIWCDTNSPRRDATEATPRAEVDEINAHNRKGALWCGWKP